ncbi:MAG: hypothetical protein AAF962_08030 [Actinomycetota bacterium]
MLLELGPVEAEQVVRWTRFARRLFTEVRLDPSDLDGVVCEDFLRHWSTLIDAWAAAVGPTDDLAGAMFRLTQTIDDEQAEFLLHGLIRCMTSPSVAARMSEADHDNDFFTGHVARAFITGLTMEGRPCEHYQEDLLPLDG